MGLPSSLVTEVLGLIMLGSHTDTGSNPGSPASHPAPCLWPERAVKDGPRLGTLHHMNGGREEAIQPGSATRIGPFTPSTS